MYFLMDESLKIGFFSILALLFLVVLTLVYVIGVIIVLLCSWLDFVVVFWIVS